MGQLLEEVAKRCPGGRVPRTYMVFDTETGGVNRYDDRIVQVGFCYVREGQIKARFAELVKRPPEYRMRQEAINVHGITHERIELEGIDYREMIPMTIEFMLNWREQGELFMGHNMVNFDAPFLEYEASLMAMPFKFGDNEIIDTGMLVKASRLNMTFRDDKESMRDFYKRVSEVRAKGVHWSLDRYCYDAYGLSKYGIDKGTAHDAGVDCQLTHHLFTELQAQNG